MRTRWKFNANLPPRAAQDFSIACSGMTSGLSKTKMGLAAEERAMITILYADGSAREGILVSIRGDELRILAREDALIFRLLGGRWISEDSETVTFEFPLAARESAGMVPEYERPPFAEATKFIPVSYCGRKWVN